MDQIQKEKLYLESRKMLCDDPIGAQVIAVTSVLNAKTAALLTHVSIMIAVSTGFLLYLSTVKDALYIIKLALFAEIGSYTIISLFCIRAIFIIDSDTDMALGELIKHRIITLGARRASYKLAIYSTMTVTIALVLTIAYDGFHSYL